MKTEPSPDNSMVEIPALIPPTSVAPSPLSRQRRWQLKMRAEGRCWRCGELAIGSLCPAHLVKERERQRRINGYERRCVNARSYIFGGATNECVR